MGTACGDPARKDNILGRNKTRLELWEEHLKDPIGQSFDVVRESVSTLTFGTRPFADLVFNSLWPRGLRRGSRVVEKAILGRCLALVGPVGSRAFTHSFHSLERSREVWAAWQALLFLFEERTDGPQGVV